MLFSLLLFVQTCVVRIHIVLLEWSRVRGARLRPINSLTAAVNAILVSLTSMMLMISRRIAQVQTVAA